MIRTIKNILFFFLISCAYLPAQQKDTLKLTYIEKFLPYGLIQKVPENMPRVGIALSGGGSRSLSQIGVLKAFEEKHIPVEDIVGTSMGSIVGGLYSAGYSLEELDSIVNKNNWDEFFSVEQSHRNELFVDQKITEDRALISLRLQGLTPVLPKSISSGQRGANFLNLLSLNAPLQTNESFDDYLFKFRAVSSDLVGGKEIILDKGPLGLAMRASSSVTFLLPPVRKDSLLLVDGGLVANIPVKETRNLGADMVIAVNTSSPLYQRNELNLPWTIADQLVSIPMQILNDQQLNEADYVIKPDLNDRKNSDFKNLEGLIKEGYNSAVPVVKKISADFEKKFKADLNIGLKYYENLTIENSSDLSLKLFDRISGKDSISNKDLLYELYLLNKNNEYNKLYFVVNDEGSTSSLKIFDTPNPIVKDFEITGDSLVTKSEIEKKIIPLLNKPYSPVNTLNTALEIMRLYKQKGYSFARIKSLRFDPYTQILFIDLSEGIISGISVAGNMRTNKNIITRELPLRVGDVFKYSNAERGLTNLRSTNLFDQVEMDVTDSSGESEITVNVIEKISGVVRFGLRIDNENLTQLSVDVRDENFLGTGTEIGAIFSGGIRNRSYTLEQKANRVFDSYLAYKIRAFYEFNDVNVYKDDSVKAPNRFSRSKYGEYRQIFYGGSFGIGTQVMRFGNIFAEARFQNDRIKNKSNYTGSTDNIFVTALRFSLLVDSQNDYPYPTDGFLIKSYYETAQTALGGDIGYTKFLFDYKSIFSPAPRHTFSLRGVLGYSDKTLPLSEQFSFGGQNSFFGLHDYEYRGRQILSASFEYRYELPIKIFFDTYLKVRYDLGSIWAEREQIRFKDLKHGVGATLSFNTPIGPADFSVGKSFYFTNTLLKNTVIWGPTLFYFTIGYYY